MSALARPSDAVLERLLALHPKRIDLALDRIQRLLAALGHPERSLPPVIHVAGTNGKGSVCAFLRAMLEGNGYRVHVYTSPHLVRFHERIRLAGELISELELSSVLEECETVNDGEPITFFEITTAAALLAFARHPGDIAILEVGLGGKYDATNVIQNPAAVCLTPVALDHQEFLGQSLAGIAAEKAGILKPGVPCVIGPQAEEAREVLVRTGDRIGAPLFVYGEDFHAHEEHGRMVYQDGNGLLDLSPPKLYGRHQIANAAIAIATLRRVNKHWARESAIERGLRNVEWPGRMQRLMRGPLIGAAPKGAEVWLDGGHNPHGAAALAQSIADLEERAPKPLYLVCGMLRTKDAHGFFSAFRGLARHVSTMAIPGEEASLRAGALYDEARAVGLDATPAEGLEDAMMQVAGWAQAREAEGPPRVLICGSLYLAGCVLAENG
ncbi:MAG: bifunctional folylpolyglutamate synthase/dihydrofolate synthase [Alphaproteobacteria bacterium]